MIAVLAEMNKSLQELRSDLIDKKIRKYKDLEMGFYRYYKHIYEYDPSGIRIVQVFQLGDYISQLSETTREALNNYARNNFEISRSIFSTAMDYKLIPKLNPIILSDWFWSTFIGVVQFEESKLKGTKKDHVLSTLEEVFLTISEAFRPAIMKL